MAITVVEEGRLLVLCGRLDVTSAADLRPELRRAVDGGTGDLVLDLRDVELLDATGLGLLVGAHRRAGRAGRRLVLRGASPQLRRLLRVTKLHRVLRVEDPLTAGV